MNDHHQTVIQCHKVSKQFSQGDTVVEVLKQVDFELAVGQQMAIIGSSGSGKSTLLHILGGLEKPSQGNVSILGQNLANCHQKRLGQIRNQSIGFIYQFHHLLPEFSALENVAMPLLIQGKTVAEAKQQAQLMLAKVGLEHRVLHKPAQLSGGERQRTAVARALVSKPACILADEPTGNLDKQNAAQVYQLMLELNQQLGASLIIVTHDHDLANAMDRQYVLEEGILSS